MTSRSARRILLAASAAVFIVLLAYFAARPDPTRLDLAADGLVRAAGNEHAWGDAPDELLIDFIFILIVDAGLVLAAWRFGGQPSALVVASALIVQELILRLTKAAIARSRPDGAYSTSGAYPSGHVANLTLSILLFLLIVLPQLRHRGHFASRLPGEAAYAGLLIATFALYRVFAGEHWLTDVIGGVALAVTVALASEEALRRLQPERR